MGFEIDGKYKLLENENACDYSASFLSVIGTGTLQIVDNMEEKKLGLNTLMKQISQHSDWNYDDKMLEAVAVYSMDVTKIACKAK